MINRANLAAISIKPLLQNTVVARDLNMDVIHIIKQNN